MKIAKGTIRRRTSRSRPSVEMSGTRVTLPPCRGTRVHDGPGRGQGDRPWTRRCTGRGGAHAAPAAPTCGSAPPAPGPLLRSFFISNYKAAPGFAVSHCHVSKWLFSVRPIRKLTHHAVTAANFFPLHVRWIAC